eukprot:snap_masked-scaffold_35-processed-gene-2.13-mRNA-1 protein AED:0.16 eAED:0.16 QI:0/-1/0/1/-1/1/1/0/396
MKNNFWMRLLMLAFLVGLVSFLSFWNHEKYEQNFQPEEINTKVMNMESFREYRLGSFHQQVAEPQLYHIILSYKTLYSWYFCVIESLAIQLSNSSTTSDINVWIVTLESLQEKKTELEALENIVKRSKNLIIRFREIDENIIFEGTPLDDFFRRPKNASALAARQKVWGKLEMQNRANGLRIALVYKLGGMYLDADFIVMNDVSELHDGLAKQEADGIAAYNNAFFKFEKNSEFLKLALAEFVRGYKDVWGIQGPQLMTRVIRKHCRGDSNPPTLEPFDLQCTGRGGRGLIKPTFSLASWGKRNGYFYRGGDAYKPWPPPKSMPQEEQERVYEIFLNPKKYCYAMHLSHTSTKKREMELCNSGFGKYKKVLRGHLRFQFCPAIMGIMEATKNCNFN